MSNLIYSLVKRPISMIPNKDFKNIKRVQLKNNAYYIDNKKDIRFEFSKLLKQYEKFLKKEYSYSNENIPDKLIDSLKDFKVSLGIGLLLSNSFFKLSTSSK